MANGSNNDEEDVHRRLFRGNDMGLEEEIDLDFG
jgi:hypothetical protein